MQKKKVDLIDYALTEEQVSYPSVIYRTLIEWREGVPYLINTPIRLSASPTNTLPELLRKCLDLPYAGKNPVLVGLSQGEAMMVSLSRAAADGDQFAIDRILDRLLGKPKQSLESVTLTGDLNSFLDTIAKETRETTIDIVRNPNPQEEVEDL